MSYKAELDMWRDAAMDEEEHYPDPEVFHHGDKYLYDYQWYHASFPEEWAICQKEGTGPGQCENCADYASINGVCIGYCANCATMYDGARGRGFMNPGVENDDTDVLHYPSAFDTYLVGVDIHAIQGIEQELMQTVALEDEDVDPMELASDDEEMDNHDISVFNCHFEGGYNDM